MELLLEQILSILRGMWRYRWYALGAAWVFCLIGWSYVYRLPDFYKSQTRVEVDAESMLLPLLSGIAFDVGSGMQLSLLTKTLLSAANLKTIAEASGLYVAIEESDGLPPQLVQDLRRRIKISGGISDDIYSIEFRDQDPDVAQQVVDATMKTFMAEAIGEAKGDTDVAQAFLDKQIVEYEHRLEEAEQKLVEFKRQNMGKMPGTGQDYYQWMEGVRQNLDRARLALRQAENRWASLDRQLKGEQPLTSTQNASKQMLPMGSLPIDTRIQNLEQQLDQMLLRYTDVHPDVVATRETIQQLMVQRKTDYANWTSNLASVSPGTRTTSANPVYQQLRMALSQEEASIASLEVEVLEYERRLKELEELVHTVPEVEAQLKALNRDYAVTQQQYGELLERRERVSLASQADFGSQSIEFKILDPPSLPESPEGPPRVIFYSAILVVGIGAGVVLAFFLCQIWPTYDTVKAIIAATSVPVYGTVELVLSGRARVRQRVKWLIYCSLAGMLFAACMGLIALEVSRFESMRMMGPI